MARYEGAREREREREKERVRGREREREKERVRGREVPGCNWQMGSLGCNSCKKRNLVEGG